MTSRYICIRVALVTVIQMAQVVYDLVKFEQLLYNHTIFFNFPPPQIIYFLVFYQQKISAVCILYLAVSNSFYVRGQSL
jgi:hypothetical protein